MRWRTQRWVVDFPTKVRSKEGPHSLTVSSVSSSGARLDGDHDLEEGDQIRISCLTDQIHATVVWVKDSTCGIKFSRPIGQKHLAVFRRPGGRGLAVWARTPPSSLHGFREL